MSSSAQTRLNTEAEETVETARSMPSGPEKIEALKKAGLLRSSFVSGALDSENSVRCSKFECFEILI